MLSRFTHGITGETRNTERRLWVDTMMTDHISHTGNDQDQTVRGHFQKIV